MSVTRRRGIVEAAAASILKAPHSFYNARMPRPEGAGIPAARALLRWYARHGRDLPWRRRPDPYRVLISEVMLQQTTVASVVPYYERFVAAFPDLESLAAAHEEDLLRLWSGLGYYRRARSLLAAARIMKGEHGGRVPDDPASLRRLPGIGPYTSEAILAIAFGRPAVALDGNLARVLARLGAYEGDPRSAEGRRLLYDAGLSMVTAGSPKAVNQALMDLGASVCTPRRPRCDACPVERSCKGRGAGVAERIPRPRRRSPTVAETLAAGIVRRGGRVLLRRRAGVLMDGLWEFPMAVASEGRDPVRALDREIRRLGGVGLRAPRSAGSVRHAITNRRIRVEIYCGEAADPRRPVRREGVRGAIPVGGRSGSRARRRIGNGRRTRSVAEAAPADRPSRGDRRGPETRWVSWGGLADLPLTGIARKIMRVVGPDAHVRSGGIG